MTRPPTPALIDALAAIVGATHAIRLREDQQPYLVEWRDRYRGATPVVLRPADTREVAQILRLCHDAHVGVVAQGGNTGLVGGQIPSATGDEIVVALGRLNDISAPDAATLSMTVGAGSILADVQAKADAAGLLYPLSLASEGSCQIGGTLSANAGGVNVLAYGTARDLVWGVEVVLADGRIWDGRRTLRKDNTGYDMTNLFVGSEGTLGLITSATLKLFRKPAERAVAFVSLASLDAVARLFSHVHETSRDPVTAFEFLPDIALQFVTAHVPGTRRPFARVQPWYVLIETARHTADERSAANLEAVLQTAVAAGDVVDATIAANAAQAAGLWRLREAISEAQKPEGGSIKHDISVPVSHIADFITAMNARLERDIPGIRPVPFGHFGDGNIHYNLSQPIGADRAAFLAQWEAISERVHDEVMACGGAISAEHGIGQLKRGELARLKSPVDLQMMRSIKAALDPHGILNPGKIFAAGG